MTPGAVRWFGPDARKLAASAGDARAPPWRRRRARPGAGACWSSRAPRRSRAERRRTARAKTRPAKRASRRCTARRGASDAGRRVERAWRVEARPPAFASDGDADGNAVSASANRVIAAAAEGDELTLVWSSGDWASYDPHAEDPGAPVRARRASEEEAPRRRPKKAGGKRGRGGAAGRRNRGRSRTPRRRRSAAGTSLWPARGGGASVTVLDARYGERARAPNVDAAGGAGGVSVAALADADDGSFRVALCLADAVALVELPARPPVSLAAALGALSAAERGAPARALGRANAAAALRRRAWASRRWASRRFSRPRVGAPGTARNRRSGPAPSWRWTWPA